jgi:hypothetical protein
MDVTRPLASAGGQLLAAVFGPLTVLRQSKPLHPRGVVVAATLTRTGLERRWGVPWLDGSGGQDALVRLSRAVGLPDRVPDVLGLAVTFTSAGRQHDLLMATTGWSTVGRHVLVPRVDPLGAVYSTLLPYDSPSGHVLLGATPEPEGPPPAFALHAARPGGAWERFATLRLHAWPEQAQDMPLSLDPVLHPLPGLWFPERVRTLREPSYARARRLRGAGSADRGERFEERRRLG